MSNAPKLLAVDDDAASAELIVRVAERCGYEAFATSDPRGVTNLVAALKPDVMAVDLTMPHIDAFELFRLLAERNYPGQLIIVSGQDEATLQTAQRAAEALGLNRPHIHQKPLNFQALRQNLGQYLKLAKAG
ncbi:response regulator [Devosia rhodophyticola]|uniref:Response regulator n=1 Tax=Devosia rhodophyticola TaxID=3026423 RepID=A0ABY7YUL0_9HYPH|nr:response regulator [Devosia rhodophyticola]WDR04994.1 response regulator [Devosia rhodophyticola]